MSKMIIVEGNSNDKDNVRAYMVKGEQGYSAYDLYVQKGGTLTEEQWLDAFLNAENFYNKTETNNLLDEKTCIYDTVALMKSDTNLKSGMTAQTLGYYSVNDGGGAIYKITDTESGTEYQEKVGILYATLLNKNVTPETLGCYGDGIHDDGEKLTNLKYFNNITFGKEKIYLSSKPITIDSSCYINLNGSTIKMYNRLEESTGNMFTLSGNNIILENGILYGDLDSRETYPDTIHGIRINGSNIEVKNLKISKFVADGIISIGNDVLIHDIDVGYCGRNNISMLYGKNVKIYNIYTHDNERKNNPGHGLVIEPYADNQIVKNLEIYNVIAENNGGNGINLSFYNNGLVNAYVHNNKCINNPMSLKLNNNSNGKVIYKNNDMINTSFMVQDPCSENFNTYISDTNIINHNPTTTSTYWGSAFLIRSGASYTGDLYNLFIDNVNIIDGTSTYGLYVSNAGTLIHNSFIKNIYCNRNDIQAMIGGNTEGLSVKNLQSDYISNVTGSSLSLYNLGTEVNVNSTNDSITILSSFSYEDYIKINNVKDSSLVITTQGSNNYGTTKFRLPPYKSCMLKVNKDGTCNIITDRIIDIIPASGSSDIKITDVNEISLIRSSYQEIYKIIGNNIVPILQNGTTGGTITIANGIATISNTSGGNLTVYLDN